MRGYKYNVDHAFYCTHCGKKGITISRKQSKCKKPGHLKKLYCLNCKIEINHVECVEFSHYDSEMFREEFLSGNFQKDGSRVVTLSQLRETLYIQSQEENIKQDCDEFDYDVNYMDD